MRARETAPERGQGRESRGVTNGKTQIDKDIDEGDRDRDAGPNEGEKVGPERS